MIDALCGYAATGNMLIIKEAKAADLIVREAYWLDKTLTHPHIMSPYVNLPTKSGQPVLHVAAQYGQYRAMVYLLEWGASEGAEFKGRNIWETLFLQGIAHKLPPALLGRCFTALSDSPLQYDEVSVSQFVIAHNIYHQLPLELQLKWLGETDFLGRSPLFVAAEKDDDKVVLGLLEALFTLEDTYQTRDLARFVIEYDRMSVWRAIVIDYPLPDTPRMHRHTKVPSDHILRWIVSHDCVKAFDIFVEHHLESRNGKKYLKDILEQAGKNKAYSIIESMKKKWPSKVSLYYTALDKAARSKPVPPSPLMRTSTALDAMKGLMFNGRSAPGECSPPAITPTRGP
jgi:hypothetical protein